MVSLTDLPLNHSKVGSLWTLICNLRTCSHTRAGTSVSYSLVDDLLESVLDSIHGRWSVDHAHDSDQSPDRGEEVQALGCGHGVRRQSQDQVTDGSGLGLGYESEQEDESQAGACDQGNNVAAGFHDERMELCLTWSLV